MQNEPNTPQSPFQVNVADRVKRLPPYLFGKINALKYAKRRAGVDVIDLGMGNPSDVPESFIIDTDHWRHFWLMLGAMWGMFAAAQRWQANVPSISVPASRPLPQSAASS